MFDPYPTAGWGVPWIPYWKYHIWLIPQCTVDNNLGPDRLEGPKAQDLKSCK